jgi:hypothetical protein
MEAPGIEPRSAISGPRHWITPRTACPRASGRAESLAQPLGEQRRVWRGKPQPAADADVQSKRDSPRRGPSEGGPQETNGSAPMKMR